MKDTGSTLVAGSRPADLFSLFLFFRGPYTFSGVEFWVCSLTFTFSFRLLFTFRVQLSKFRERGPVVAFVCPKLHKVTPAKRRIGKELPSRRAARRLATHESSPPHTARIILHTEAARATSSRASHLPIPETCAGRGEESRDRPRCGRVPTYRVNFVARRRVTLRTRALALRPECMCVLCIL